MVSIKKLVQHNGNVNSMLKYIEQNRNYKVTQLSPSALDTRRL